VTEYRFFDEGTVPAHCTSAWYAERERAPHLEQPAHRPRLVKAAEYVREAVHVLGARSISDLGAGDGGLLSLVQNLAVPSWGYDLMPANVEAAVNERHVAVSLGNFEKDDVQYGECVVLTEVLEHLRHPHETLRTLPPVVRFVVASSPNGETWESHYEFHTWGWDTSAYRGMFAGAVWNVLKHEAIPGFQVSLAGR
jgi:2-polyprenyl-3-methyl-5-hydroxy-6-metoxy-1,4-benzoquinol methylase